jgi:hypothetical protein
MLTNATPRHAAPAERTPVSAKGGATHRRNLSPEGRQRIAEAQRRRRPMAVVRRCESLAPAEGHTATFAPGAANQKRCRACCRADPYNLAKNKADRRARRVACPARTVAA